MTTTAPLRNDNDLKLGVFSMNASGGAVMTTAEGTLQGTWDEQLAVAKAADEAGWEFLLPVARWKGMPGPSQASKRSFEVFTWASAVTAITQQIQVFATAHVPIFHPMLAAKQGATIEQIGGGRFGLNIVSGWNDDEIGMFGRNQLSHDDRYRATDEWVRIVKKLWTEEGELDFDGNYFSVQAGEVYPKPIQDPYPTIVNAGQSPAGIRFSAEHADFSFQAHSDLDKLAQMIKTSRELARTEFNRDLGILTIGTVVCRDTEAEAREYVRYYVEERGDFVSADSLIAKSLKGDVQIAPKELVHGMQRALISGKGGLPLVGTAEQIVDQMAHLHKIGIGGIGLVWVDYETGIKQFNAEILPLLIEAGLRKS